MYSQLLEEISRAIGARLLLEFTYKGETYLVEPYLLGINKLDQNCLRAWQINSPTKLIPENGWASFVLSEMRNLKIQDKPFSKKRPGYDPYDSSMDRICYRI